MEKITQTEEKQLTDAEMSIIEAMIEAGVLHGRKHSSTNPRMNQFIFGTRRGVDIFDLEKTAEMLNKAIGFLKKIREEGKQIVIVGVKPATKDLVRKCASVLKMPYVTERWLGGTLTNFLTIQKRIEHLVKLRSDRDSGKLEKYTKKEQLLLTRKLEKMENLFGGIETMREMPGAMLVIDTQEHLTAIREARRMKVPIVGLINTDGNPDDITYNIPCNDNARKSVGWILDAICREIEGVKPLQSAVANEKTLKETAKKIEKKESQEKTQNRSTD